MPSAELQSIAWSKAVEKALGRVPTAKIVKEVVQQRKNKGHTHKPEPAKSFVSLKNPRIGQQVRICENHPLFPQEPGIIIQIPNNGSAIVELSNQQQRELIDLKDLEIQRIVGKNGKISTPSEGINYIQGMGVEWYVRVDEDCLLYTSPSPRDS